ncbi:MAG: alpha/beta hydrolase [Dehalococcoidia bacterium]|nr:alpha/beta hydrolase [Dehalococcoidia bacterium]
MTTVAKSADRRFTRTLRIARNLAIAITALLLISFAARYMLILDRMMIYFPQRGLEATPDSVGLAYEDVYLTASDGTRIHGWHIPGRSNVTLLWFHGNAGNISHRLDNILILHQRLGVSVFIIDYRGYGLSEGKPSEKGLYMDAEAAMEYLKFDLGLSLEDDVVLMGRSLGVGMAVEMATRHRVRGVILESGFTSIREMAEASGSILPIALVLLMFEARYDSISKIARVESPVMVLHGDRDDTVPYWMAEKLYGAANEPKTLYPIRGASHNDTVYVGGEGYLRALSGFIDGS